MNETKKLNSPNDLAIDKNCNIYFTDPRYGNRDNMEMQVEGVYFRDVETIKLPIADAKDDDARNKATEQLSHLETLQGALQ